MNTRLVLEINYNNRPVFRGLIESFPVIVGRSPECDIPLTNFDFLSRQHLKVDVVDDRYIVTDLGSSNGIYHEGKKVKSLFLDNNCTLRVGGSKFIFKILTRENLKAYQKDLSQDTPVPDKEKTITEISLHGSIHEALDFEFHHKQDLMKKVNDDDTSLPEIEILEPSISKKSSQDGDDGDENF